MTPERKNAIMARSRISLVLVAVAAVALFVGLKATSGGLQWLLIAVGVAMILSLALSGLILSRRD